MSQLQTLVVPTLPDAVQSQGSRGAGAQPALWSTQAWATGRGPQGWTELGSSVIAVPCHQGVLEQATSSSGPPFPSPGSLLQPMLCPACRTGGRRGTRGSTVLTAMRCLPCLRPIHPPSSPTRQSLPMILPDGETEAQGMTQGCRGGRIPRSPRLCSCAAL